MYKCHFTTEVVQPDFLTGGVPRDFVHRECFAPWELNSHLRYIRKFMGKLFRSSLNGHILRIFKNSVDFLQNVRSSKNLTPAVNRQPGFRREDS